MSSKFQGVPLSQVDTAAKQACLEPQQGLHWRRWLAGTGARAALHFQLFNFLATSEPQKL